MLSYDDVVAFLMAACPTYEGSPERAAVDDASGEYVRATGLVRHLIRLRDEQDTRSFRHVFAVVEWILADGEPAAIDLVQAGFLDDLSDVGLYAGKRVRAPDFGPWLGPRARAHPKIRAILTTETP
jgi:hypothetical protein